jgi:excisionase family DNA binding protein
MSSKKQTGKLISIGQTAKVLGVSVDTIRRWDKEGVLNSARADGKTRFFSVKEVEAIKFEKPVTIKELAKKSGVTRQKLKQLEMDGEIKPKAIRDGKAVYNYSSLKKFLSNINKQTIKTLQNAALGPLGDATNGGSAKQSVSPATKALLKEHQLHIKGLKRFQKAFLYILAGTGVVCASLILTLTVLFFVAPQGSSRALGYFKKEPTTKKFVANNPSWLAQKLKPFSQTSLRIVEAVNPELRKKIAPFAAIEDINQVFRPNENGEVESVYTFTVPDTSYIKIPDQGLVENLNSDYTHGRFPGEKPGNIAILPIGGDQIKDGSITLDKFAPGVIKPSGQTVVNSTSGPLTASSVTSTGSGSGSTITYIYAGIG